MKLTTNGLGLLIGDFLLPYYGAMILCGLIVACLIGYLLVRHHKMEARILAILAATGLLGGLVGAKLLYVLQNWKEIDFSGSEWQSGFVFYGGLIGALITLLFVGKFTKIPVLSYLRIAVACIPVAHGFGRIGCHLVGCCYGIEYNGFLAKRYTNSMVPGLNGRSVFPVQMTEAICLFIIGIVLIIYVWKSKELKYAISLYVIMYSVLRFCLEYVRGDDAERKIIGWLSTSQWISIILILLVIMYHFARKNINKKRGTIWN